MNTAGWIQLLVYVAVLVALTKPMGLYLHAVLEPRKPGRIEGPILRLLRVNPDRGQTWKQYAVAMFLYSAVGMLLTYVMLRWQSHMPLQGQLNPQKFPSLSGDLSFNTAASFTTNTNWQSYGGENTMSYLSQMVALVSHNFSSAAVGICIAAVLIRGLARQKSKTIGNFWVDLVRTHLYLLFPICIVYALFLISQGMIQNYAAYTPAGGLDQNAAQSIAQGPVASQVAIKMLGTNGGGFFNTNAAHPFENPTPLSNFIQMVSIFAIPAGLTYYLGRMLKKQSHGWTVFACMLALFLGGVLVLWFAEASGNPRVAELGVNPGMTAYEGKETRFGVFNSALFATITTDASCGAVNCMHDSLTPLGGLVPLFNIHTGEVIFGGVGAGMYGILIFVVLSIFIAGLMVGRTPEYLGKKIEGFDVKCAVLAIVAPSLSILGFTAWAAVSGWGQAGLNNNGAHGFSEILYAFTSGAGNNGSAFAGLTTNTPWYNTTLAFDMLVGRFFMIVPLLAMAGNMAVKRVAPASSGSFPVSGPTFGLLLGGTIVVVGALTFLPALAMGPIVEHFIMQGSTATY